MLHEDAAQPLGVFGGHRDAVAAAPVGRAGPGVAGFHGDGPALQVFGGAFRLRWPGVGRAAVGVHDQHAAVPLRGKGDPVERSLAVFAGVAARFGGHFGRTGAGLGRRRDDGRGLGDGRQAAHEHEGGEGEKGRDWQAHRGMVAPWGHGATPCRPLRSSTARKRFPSVGSGTAAPARSARHRWGAGWIGPWSNPPRRLTPLGRVLAGALEPSRQP